MSWDVKRKFSVENDFTSTVDFHSTRPWLLTGSGFVKGDITIYNLESGKAIHSFSPGASVVCAKFIPRKNWYIVGLQDPRLCVFDCTTHKEVASFKDQDDYINCLAVHPTAPILLTGSYGSTIKTWDWDKQWHNIHTYKGHTEWITSVAFNPKDTNTFASSSYDGTVKMWSITSPTPHFTIKAHNQAISYVDFHPGADKPYLVTASHDNTVKVWDYFSQTCVQTIAGHTSLVTFAVFHPSLPIIISGGVDGAVKFWNIETYGHEYTLNYKPEMLRCVAFRKDTSEVAVAFNWSVITFELAHNGPFQRAISGSDMSGGTPKELATKDRVPEHELHQFTQSLDNITITDHDDPTLSLPPAPSQSVNPYQQCSTLVMELMAAKITNLLISELKGDKAQYVADFLSKMVSDEEKRDRKHALHLLSKLAKSAEVFPQSLVLKGAQCNLTNAVAWGGYGVIYKGLHEGTTICIKAVQANSQGIDEKKLRAHASELTIWANLKHRNILPFLGIYSSKEEVPRICIVSPWMMNGDLLQYLGKVLDAPRKPLVHDILSGLQYLHDLDIIHADLKAKNVLVSETGKAMLADFGISRLSITLTTALTNAGTGTVYWMAPELLLEQKPVSRESDIWAFACTCYEMIAGTMPFSEYYNIALLIGGFVMKKFTPKKPAPGIGWDEDVWSMATRCWQGDPTSRPNAQELLDMISRFDYTDDRPSDLESQRSRTAAEIDYDCVLSILDEIRQSVAA